MHINKRVHVSILMVAFILILSVVFIHGRAKNKSAVKGRWTLKGTEILLELQPDIGRETKYPYGIYSIDPFERNPKPQLLIPGGNRPTWNPGKNGFAYIEGNSVEVVNNNDMHPHIGYSESGNLGFNDPLVYWRSDGQEINIDRNWCSGTILVYPPGGVGPLFSIGPQDAEHPNNIRGWKDVFSVKSLGFSPDGKKIAAEISPFAPDDLLRNESKIYIYNKNPTDHSYDIIPNSILSSNDLHLGKRLTKLEKNSCELQPLWSPDGKWIAFNVVHFDKEYVTPAVCRPDGSEYTELLPSNARELDSANGIKQNWVPIAPLRPDKSKSRMIPILAGWGNPHVKAIEWSCDGRYLLLNRNDYISGTAEVATYRNGKWYVGDIGQPGNPGMVSLGPSEAKSCQVAAISLDGTNCLYIINKVNSNKPNAYLRLRRIRMPHDISIKWLDW